MVCASSGDSGILSSFGDCALWVVGSYDRAVIVFMALLVCGAPDIASLHLVGRVCWRVLCRGVAR